MQQIFVNNYFMHKNKGRLLKVYFSKNEECKTDGKSGMATDGFLSIPIGKYKEIQPEILFFEKKPRATGIILRYPNKIK
jgi:hypothetical protein